MPFLDQQCSTRCANADRGPASLTKASSANRTAAKANERSLLEILDQKRTGVGHPWIRLIDPHHDVLHTRRREPFREQQAEHRRVRRVGMLLAALRSLDAAIIEADRRIVLRDMLDGRVLL